MADKLIVGLMLEDAADNPLLSHFYDNPGAYALPIQAHFLIDKDALFSRATLHVYEYELYRHIYDQLA